MKRPARVWLVPLVVLAAGGCGSRQTGAPPIPAQRVLNVGLGAVDAADEEYGVRQVIRNQSIEPLIKHDETGRPVPFLAERWSLSPDGLQLTVQLKPVTFHDGSPATAADVQVALSRSLPQLLGPLYDDITKVDVVSEREVAILFKRRSAFAVDTLDVQLTKKDAPAIGTGPFVAADPSAAQFELVSNKSYHLGQPAIDRMILKPYSSVRSAWADLLRGRVDMLYEVGVDAIDSLEPSSRVRVYSFRRHYMNVGVFNFRRPALKDPGLRRLLNSAIDRPALINEALAGYGSPATGPVWPGHWAHSKNTREFQFEPTRIAGKEHLKLTCIFPSVVNERLALVLQRQLQSVGVDLALESLPLDAFARRLASGDYDVMLTEANGGPSLIRPYVFWHSKAPYNFGAFSSREVDAALDRIRRAENDDEYRAGVAAFQQAVANDPPAIFLSWIDRARALSSSFEAPSEAGRDILNAIHLWRPSSVPAAAPLN